MANNIFREKSIERISSPDDLGEYLRVTKPSVFVILIATMLILGGLFVWSYFMSITSYAYGTAKSDGKVLLATFNNPSTSKYINDSMELIVGNQKLDIGTIGMDDKGNITAVCICNIPEGNYEVKVGYRKTQLIDMLIN